MQKVAEDLEQLRILRDYLIFKRKVRIPYDVDFVGAAFES